MKMAKGIRVIETKAYEWQCPECGKVFRSLSPRQLNAWIIAHELKHGMEKK